MSALTPWHWLALGTALAVLEVFAPGAFLLWLGVAALLVGGLLALIPGLGWEAQLLAFSALAVASVTGWVRYRARHPKSLADNGLNRRGQQYVGRTFTLHEAIINGEGRLRVDDTVWKIRGPDLAAGTQVRVTAVNGTVLLVAPA